MKQQQEVAAEWRVERQSAVLDQYKPTLEPEEGWRFVDNKTEVWAGWRVHYTRPAPTLRQPKRRTRHTFVLYGSVLSREQLERAIEAHIGQAGR